MLRHGQTEWNVAGRYQGQNNSPLTVQGAQDARRQGALLAQVFARHPAIDLFASPLGRVRQTVDLAMNGYGRVPVFHDSLKEIHIGSWEGLSLSQIESGWPDIFNACPAPFDLLAMAPDGEGFDHLYARCTDFLNSLTAPSVLFTHGATMAVLRSIARGLPICDIGRLDHRQGCIYRIENAGEDILDAPSSHRAGGTD